MKSAKAKRLVLYAGGFLSVVFIAAQALTFFLGKIHMQGVVDIAAKSTLEKMLSGIASQAEIKSNILTEIGARDLNSPGFGKIGAKDICFDSLNCSAAVRVVGGCYDPTRKQFSCSPALGNLSCTSPATPSVFALMEAFPTGHIMSLFVSSIGLLGFESSVDALAYGNMQSVLRDQPQLITSVSQCNSL